MLAEGAPDVDLSRRARGRLDETRDAFSWVETGGTAVVRDPSGASRWWTFAGLRANTVLGESLGAVRLAGAREENLSIRLRDGTVAGDVKDRLAGLARATGADAAQDAFPARDDAVESLKFSACLPRALALRTLRARGSDRDAVRACARGPLRQVFLA